MSSVAGTQAPLVSQVVSSWLITEAGKHGNESKLDKYAIIGSLAILAYMLQSVYMTIVTYGCFLGSVGGSSGILYLIIVWTGQEVSTTAPALMTPIGLAMSIDYCLFMMSRYRIELQSDWDDEIDTADIVQDAVAQAAVADDAASEVDVQMSGTAQCFAKMWKRISCRGASDGKGHDPKQMQSVTTVNETAGMVVSLRCASVPLTQQCAC